jgi:hypothetical protein
VQEEDDGRVSNACSGGHISGAHCATAQLGGARGVCRPMIHRRWRPEEEKRGAPLPLMCQHRQIPRSAALNVYPAIYETVPEILVLYTAEYR